MEVTPLIDPKKPVKRRQVRRACTNCHKAHACCSEERPCRRCVQSGLEDSCADVVRKRRRSTKAESPQSNTLEPPTKRIRTDIKVEEAPAELPMPLTPDLLGFDIENPFFSVPSPMPEDLFVAAGLNLAQPQAPSVSQTMTQFGVGATEAMWGQTAMFAGLGMNDSQSLHSALFQNALLDNLIASHRNNAALQRQNIAAKLSSEAKSAQPTLSSMLMGQVVETTGVGVLVCGIDSSILEWNPAACRMLQYTPADLGSRVLSLSDVLPSNQFNALSASLLNAFQTKQTNLPFAGTWTTSSGVLLPLRADFTIVYDRSGEGLCLVAHLMA